MRSKTDHFIQVTVEVFSTCFITAKDRFGDFTISFGGSNHEK